MAAACLIILCPALSGGAFAAEVKPVDWLVRARLAYNQQQFDQAIAAATNAVKSAELADRARLVIGRAHVERFRRAADPTDLIAGREALRSVQVAALPERERSELVLGLGECLYLDNMFGAAADIFSSALAPEVPADVRDVALDWWATSLDRLAQLESSEQRQAIYLQIVRRTERELEQSAPSTSAAYWLAAAARGGGDLGRAWDAAVSGWVRSLLSPQRGPALKVDLDELVTAAIIPERARELAETPADREKAIAALKSEWDAVKGAWK